MHLPSFCFSLSSSFKRILHVKIAFVILLHFLSLSFRPFFLSFIVLPSFFLLFSFFYLQSVIKTKIEPSDWLDEEVDNLAREGLRTLVFVCKSLSDKEYEDWNKGYNLAKAQLKACVPITLFAPSFSLWVLVLLSLFVVFSCCVCPPLSWSSPFLSLKLA